MTALFHFCSLRLSYVTFFFNAFLLKWRGRNISVGKKIATFGAPILMLKRNSRLAIGSNCTFRSKLKSNVLGVGHPVIFSTLRAGAEIVIGNCVGISGGALCAMTSINIGNRVLIGANTTIADSDFHPLSPESRRMNGLDIRTAPITIGDDVFIGTGCLILKGVSIGENSVIGAGSVVTKDIPPWVIAAGNPCEVVRDLRS